MFTGRPKTVITAVFADGITLGAGAVISVDTVNSVTSTTSFCTSSHSMRTLAKDDGFKASAHFPNTKGMATGCGDCHIPAANIFAETYFHISHGPKDFYAEQTNDFGNSDILEAKRVELAHQVREEIRSLDSVTCRGCHDPARPCGAMNGTSES